MRLWFAAGSIQVRRRSRADKRSSTIVRRPTLPPLLRRERSRLCPRCPAATGGVAHARLPFHRLRCSTTEAALARRGPPIPAACRPPRPHTGRPITRFSCTSRMSAKAGAAWSSAWSKPTHVVVALLRPQPREQQRGLPSRVVLPGGVHRQLVEHVLGGAAEDAKQRSPAVHHHDAVPGVPGVLRADEVGEQLQRPTPWRGCSAGTGSA